MHLPQDPAIVPLANAVQVDVSMKTAMAIMMSAMATTIEAMRAKIKGMEYGLRSLYAVCCGSN